MFIFYIQIFKYGLSEASKTAFLSKSKPIYLKLTIRSEQRAMRVHYAQLRLTAKVHFGSFTVSEASSNSTALNNKNTYYG